LDSGPEGLRVFPSEGRNWPSGRVDIPISFHLTPLGESPRRYLSAEGGSFRSPPCDSGSSARVINADSSGMSIDMLSTRSREPRGG
jgi:hypothetical protein